MNSKTIITKYTTHFTAVPQLTPRDRSVDGPLLGNGDMEVAIGGDPSQLKMFLCKNDLWRLQHQFEESNPVPLGHLLLSIPGLEGASYLVTQDLYSATTKGMFAKGGASVAVTTYVAAKANLLVLEMSAEGKRFEGRVSLLVKAGLGSENEVGKTGEVFWGKGRLRRMWTSRLARRRLGSGWAKTRCRMTVPLCSNPVSR
jgi:hypothetical protein